MDEKHCSIHTPQAVEDDAHKPPTSGSAAPVTSENIEPETSCKEPSTFQLVIILAGLWVSKDLLKQLTRRLINFRLVCCLYHWVRFSWL
jgi:hypothetical protein